MKCQFIIVFLMLTLTGVCVFAQNETETRDFLSQIQVFQRQTGIQIQGLEKVQNGAPILTSNRLNRQIKELFNAYNYIAIQNKKGKIERVVILNKKQQAKIDKIVLPAIRQGNHFTIDAALSGDGRLWENATLLVDTGADTVVLPESMIDMIGLKEAKFTEAIMQTANGEAKAKIGLLKELKIQGESIENVEAAFVPDALLGENKLLGMSVLNRFQLNIDDKNQLITLIKKPGSSGEP